MAPSTAPNGNAPSRRPHEPTQLSITLKCCPDMRVHVHLTVLANSIVLFLTSASIDSAASNASAAALGSFVYAMPDVCAFHDPLIVDKPTENVIHLRTEKLTREFSAQRYNPTQPLSTPLYTTTASIDFTTRLAKVLTRRTKKPCYVGGSIDLSNAAGGGSVEEEMEAFRAVVEVVTRRVTALNQSG